MRVVEDRWTSSIDKHKRLPLELGCHERNEFEVSTARGNLKRRKIVLQALRHPRMCPCKWRRNRERGRGKAEWPDRCRNKTTFERSVRTERRSISVDRVKDISSLAVDKHRSDEVKVKNPNDRRSVGIDRCPTARSNRKSLQRWAKHRYLFVKMHRKSLCWTRNNPFPSTRKYPVRLTSRIGTSFDTSLNLSTNERRRFNRDRIDEIILSR